MWAKYAVALLFLFSLALADDANTCILSAPTQVKKMPACCWYSNSTCCTKADADEIQVEQDEAFLEITSGNEANHTLVECFTYFENMLCMLCDPNLTTFFQIDNQTFFPSVVLCKSYCNGFYDSCSKLPEFKANMELMNITTGTSLCTSIPELAEMEEEENNSTTKAIARNSLSVVERLYSSYSKDESDGFQVSIIVSKSDCYAGADSDTIGNSECTPWGGDYPEGSSEEESSGAGSSNDGDGSSDDGSSLYWLFILFSILILLAIVCCCCFVVAAVVIRRKQLQGNSGGDSYPNNLEELED